MKSNRSQVYRKLIKSEKEKKLKTALKKYKRRFYRNRTPKNTNSPNSKVKRMTKGLPVTAQVKRKLLLGETLLTQIKEHGHKIQTQKEKHILSQVVSGSLFRKYNLVTDIRDFLLKCQICAVFTFPQMGQRPSIGTDQIFFICWK